MDKGYYTKSNPFKQYIYHMSQSTIKMDKGYYIYENYVLIFLTIVAIHNKNGQGLLRESPYLGWSRAFAVAIHNKNGQGLLQEVELSTTDKVVSRNPQ